jgi:hypothetical protein
MSPIDSPPQFLTERVIRVAEPLARDPGTSGPTQRRIVSLQVQEPAAEWIRPAVKRIEDLTGLARGWDSYDARSVSAENALAAVRFLLDNAYRELSEPAIVPLPDGGIQVEWHRGGLDVEIAFSEEESGIYVEDHEHGETVERSLGEAAALLFQMRQRLAV